MTEPLRPTAWISRNLHLTHRVWVASAVLAGLRTASNDPQRATVRDRGSAKNRLNDVQGCLGELIALRVAEHTWPSAATTITAMDWDGPSDDVDLRVADNAATLAFEAKCHLDEPQKKLFLINSVAHRRSVARGADAYLPIVSRLGSSRAVVGRPLLLDEVASWPTRTWPSRPESDPALTCDLTTLAHESFEDEWPAIRQTLKASRVADESRNIWPAYEIGISRYDSLRRARPAWNELNYDRLVGELVALAG